MHKSALIISELSSLSSEFGGDDEHRMNHLAILLHIHCFFYVNLGQDPKTFGLKGVNDAGQGCCSLFLVLRSNQEVYPFCRLLLVNFQVAPPDLSPLA
jgi:hypothetical protein